MWPILMRVFCPLKSVEKSICVVWNSYDRYIFLPQTQILGIDGSMTETTWSYAWILANQVFRGYHCHCVAGRAVFVMSKLPEEVYPHFVQCGEEECLIVVVADTLHGTGQVPAFYKVCTKW